MHSRLLSLGLLVGAWLVAPAGAGGQASSQAPPSQAPGRHMMREFDPQRDGAHLEDPRRDGWQQPEEVLRRLNLRPGMKIADIGAGTGYFSVRLARHESAPLVYAVDIAPKMVEFVRERAAKEKLDRLRAVLGGETSPNLPEAVDLVLVVNTYHHIADRVAYFRKLGASLRPQARIAIIDWKKEAPMGPPAPHRFPPEQIESEMGQAGYRLIEQHDFLPHQHFLIFTRILGPQAGVRTAWDGAFSGQTSPLAGEPRAIAAPAALRTQPGKRLTSGI